MGCAVTAQGAPHPGQGVLSILPTTSALPPPPRPLAQTFLPLLMLGGVFSAVFVRTRNLLPPIVLHSLWNVYVLSNLVKPG